MPDSFKRLNTVRTFSSGAGSVIYTVPGSTTGLVRKIQISNNGTAAATVKLHHVESGGAADGTNVILPTTVLGVNEHGENDAPFAMAAGDSIRAYGDGTNAVTINIYGLEAT